MRTKSLVVLVSATVVVVCGVVAVVSIHQVPRASAQMAPPASCVVNTDCPDAFAGQVCQNGQCVYGTTCSPSNPCAAASDGAGEECISGQCTAVQCGPGISCPSNGTCINSGYANAYCSGGSTSSGSTSNPTSTTSGTTSPVTTNPTGGSTTTGLGPACVLNGLSANCILGDTCSYQGTAFETCTTPPPASFSCSAGLTPYLWGTSWTCITMYTNGETLPTGCDSATDLSSPFCQPTLHGQYQIPNETISANLGWVLAISSTTTDGFPAAPSSCPAPTAGVWVWTGPGSMPTSCPPDLANPFGNNTSTTSTGGSTGGSTTSPSATTGGSNPVLSTANSVLENGLAGFSSILSNIAGQVNAQSVTPSGSSGSSGTSAASGSGTSGSGTCAASAQATISNSLTTLQGLATVLTSSNVSPGVLTSIQNLINAVGQVLSALAGCISS